ncbi:MAG: 1-acyl-sn-glycerol-3-phosphate acyltransferase, partial [Campylobacterales bacterium]|nr:1-acyl-sn-glycerol-3-phosphate acyltransferase [Campylobacterales bacterium]
MVSVKNILTNKNPGFFRKYPKFFTDFSTLTLGKILKEREINDFLSTNKELEGFDFVDAVLEKLNFTYKFSSRSKSNIPSSGKLIIIANHPLGALDALSLISFVREVRGDVKIVANDILMSIPNLQSLLLGLDITKKSSVRADMKNILNALNNEEAIIIFPAGEVSRARPVGVRDTAWESGF